MTIATSAAQTGPMDNIISPTSSRRTSVEISTTGKTDRQWPGPLTIRGSGWPTGGAVSSGGIDRALLNNGTRLPLPEGLRPSTLRISLDSPANGAQFAAHSEITLVGTTTERVAAVEFYDGSASLGVGFADGLFRHHLVLSDGLSAGTHALRVRTADTHGLVVWSPASIVTVSASPTAVPAIKMVEPVANTVYPDGSSVILRAEAEDASGQIDRVEFYDDEELIAAVATPSSTATTRSEYVSATWIVASPGVHPLHARAYVGDALSSDSSTVSIRVVPTLPYATSFEAREKYRLGSIDGQLGWQVGLGAAAISAAAAFDGMQAVELSGGPMGGRVVQVFGPSVLLKPIFVDLMVRPAATSTGAEGTQLNFDGARLGFVPEGSLARWAVPSRNQHDDTVWTPFGEPQAIDSQNISTRWIRLTARIDPHALTWDLFIDGQLAGFDLGLDPVHLGPGKFHRFSVRGGVDTTSYFDFFFAGFENPLFADTDGDGMDDAWERANALDPTRDDRKGDRDGDGLTNLEEYFRGTRADLADTDADGLPDAWEIRYRLDPLHPASGSSDADVDGLDDLREFIAGTDPTNPDSDGDGLPDGWEATHGLNPLLADSVNDADQDGISNLEEYRRGTDPTDFFDGLTPRILAPNGPQAGAKDELALIAQKPDGTPWANAPVTFRITSGSRRLAVSAGRGPYVDIVELRADANGLARVYLEPLEP